MPSLAPLTPAELEELRRAARSVWSTLPLADKITWQGFEQFFAVEYLQRGRR